MSTDAASWFAGLNTAPLRVFAEALAGKPIRGKSVALVRAIESALASPEALTAMVSKLPAAGRLALDALCDAREPVPEAYVYVGLAHLAGEEDGAAGLAAVRALGIVLRTKDSELLLPPPLASALRPLFDAWWRNDHPDAPPAEVRGLPFTSLVLLGHLAHTRPRVTKDGELYSGDVKRLARQVSGGPHAVHDALLPLIGLRLIHADETTGRLAVDARRRDALFALPVPELARQAAERWSRRLDRARAAALGLLVRRPGNVPRARVVWSAFAATSWRSERHWLPSPPYLLERTQRVVGALARDLHGLGPLVDSASESEGDALRATGELRVAGAGVDATPRAQSSGPVCHVQPNFEIIVPPEVAATELLGLGEIAELVHLDRVARMRVTEASVRDAMAAGIGVEAILERLRGASRHPLPPNVEQGVRDFAAGATPVHVFSGVVVVVPPGVKAPPPFRSTGVPGVFVAPAGKERQARARLEKAGLVPVGEQAADPEPPPTRDSDRERERDAPDTVRLWLEDWVGAVPSTHHAPPPPGPPSAANAASAASAAPAGGSAATGDGGDPSGLALLFATLPHAPPQWLEHLRSHLEDVLKRRPRELHDLPALLRNDSRSASLAMESALHGFSCCEVPPLLGVAALEASIVARCDVLVFKAPDAPALHVTPHRIQRAGRRQILEGHTVSDGERIAFYLDEYIVARGPPTSDIDGALAHEAGTSPSPSRKSQGRPPSAAAEPKR